MKPPMCKFCKSPHWAHEEHRPTDALEEVRKLGASVLRNQTPTVTKPSDENVTEPVDSVTPEITSSTAHISPEELERADYTHGGARGGSGRKRQHKTNAERQRAYRAMKMESVAVSAPFRLTTDQDYDGHLTDNPNNATPRESCWGDARQGQYSTQGKESEMTFQEWLDQYIRIMKKVRGGEEMEDWLLPPFRSRG